MKPPPIPPDEAERLAALRRYDLLDTLPEQVYDDLTQLAAYICKTPMSLVSLVDADRQWFKSRIGVIDQETDKTYSFCAHAIVTGDLFVVGDATEDERFAGNPFVLGPPDIRFYAGAPLITRDGYPLGTLCVIDRQPRRLTPEQERMLRALSRQVMSQIELRLHIQDQQRIEQLKSEFVSLVSHELRTPLTSIRGSLGLIEGGVLGELPAAMVRMIGIAKANSERLIRLINDILDVEKMDAGRLELTKRPLDPDALVEDALAEIKGMADQYRVRLAWEADPAWTADRPPLYGDRDRLLQVLINLLSNAIKVSPADAVVHARIGAPRGERLRLSVTDHGPGIPREALGRIFQRFQQVDPSDSRARGGTGLGLAICKGIVEQHGGAIGLDTEEGRGSTFWFEIPVATRLVLPAGAHPS